MTLEQLRELVAETAKALDELSAELQGALDDTAGCGCHEITIERETSSPFLIVRCNKGRVTKVNAEYATLTMVNNYEVIEFIALRVAADHGLDAKIIARELQSALTRRDGTATISVR